ncbi:phage tail sheath family protein [Trichocoleus sp. FACHB-591]|uniref:phage tail sheath family protein n=1 Tax=Trichocoleus sp. FACHB-591 TaxID=2692872 RepID=UPI001684FDBE|nr:phage tail sheath family protein [Trichocoleus sp. FACHB-591]MBD2095630.1 phage tail sheath family protein [Trichocoleus sp. FACHB-591]
MASTYKTPGVYIEEISKFPPSIAEVETAIPAFIGYTKQAVIGGIDYHADPNSSPVPVRITSLLEYEQFFCSIISDGKGNKALSCAENETGITVDATKPEVPAKIINPSPHNMYYSLQGYFANGGGPCYIVSVGKTSSPADVNPEELKAGLDAIEKEDEVTLIVFPESLSLKTAQFQSLYDAALAQCAKLQDRFVVLDADLETERSIFEAATTFRSSGIGINNLKYGAAYGPRLASVFSYAYNEENVTVTLPALKNENGKNVIDPSGQPTDKKMKEINPKETPDTQYGEFYPLVKGAVTNLPVVLPAAPLVVGVYASVDSTRGVWKAPANVSLISVIGPTIKISSEEQENLNLDTSGKSINAIRAFTGKGTLIWGARTLAGNDNEWRYIPVRRFFNMAEESIKKASEQFVFEPNDANTWTKVKAMIENFLILQWRAGALAGAKPDQAFYVKIGLNETMTALDILEGRMIVEIGMAVVRPAEFIILKFSHKMQES